MKKLFIIVMIACISIPLNISAQSGRIKKRKNTKKNITSATVKKPKKKAPKKKTTKRKINKK